MEPNITNLNELSNYVKLSPVLPNNDHVSLGTGLRAIIFIIPLIISVAILIITLATAGKTFGAIPVFVELAFLICWGIIVSGIRVVAQWEEAVILRLGKFNSIKGSGIIFVIPFIDFAKFVDVRLLTLHIPRQSVITRDNVPIEIDAVLFYKVDSTKDVIINIQDYKFAVSQYAQNSLRDVVGGLSLDDVLSEREQIQKEICNHIQEKVKEWGMHVDSIRLQDIQMPEDLKRMMSRQASAEREKRATIIKAEGDKLASVNLAEAAKIMNTNIGAMQLRTLQTIDGLGASPSNTVVLFPIEILELVDKFKGLNTTTEQ